MSQLEMLLIELIHRRRAAGKEASLAISELIKIRAKKDGK